MQLRGSVMVTAVLLGCGPAFADRALTGQVFADLDHDGECDQHLEG